MVRPFEITGQSGPSATADWLEIEPHTAGGRKLVALPGAGGARGGAPVGPPSAAFHVVAAPALGRAPTSGDPLVGLTLVLSRRPEVEDDSLEPFVTGGVLALTLTVTPTNEDLRRVSEEANGGSAAPIFVRRASWTIVDTARDDVVAESVVSGNGVVALSQTVSRDVALSLLAALRGDESSLVARSEIAFRAAGGGTAHQEPVADEWSGGQTTIVLTSVATNVERKIVLERALSALLKEALRGTSLDEIVHAVCPDANGVLGPIGERVTETRSAPMAIARSGFAAMGGTVAEMSAVLKTSAMSKINAHALATSGIAIKPQMLAQHWQIQDMVLQTPGTADQNLPVVEGDVALWRDRVDGARFWYAPEFTVVEPAPTATPKDSPFVFSFAVVGHDQQGRPGLEAKISFTLRVGMSTATLAAWEARGRPRSDPVPMNGLSVALEVPFRDPNGVAATQTINSTEIRSSGNDIVVTFALTDQWARLAYGALGTKSFQSRPAGLALAYVFPAYVPLREGPVVWGGKVAALDKNTVKRPPLAAAAVGLHHPVVAHPALLAQPVPPTHHPVLTPPHIFVRPTTYGIRTQGRSLALEAFLPCSKFGALYIQSGDAQAGEADQAIGCRDAWTLGQIQLRLYEPLEVNVGAPDPGFTVFRSIQVPGRFLVLPKRYTITRFEPDDGRAYRPAIYLYSNVDAVHPERTSCILMATLRPAITPANRRALIDTLRTTAHPQPTIEWPTELSVEPRYSWAIPGGEGAARIIPAAAKTPEGFQVSISAGIDQILQLKAMVETSGLAAGVTFPLADGTVLQSTLSVDLSHIDGPWEAGAVALTLADGRATLVNRVERAADIVDVLTYAGQARAEPVQVERRIEAGSSLDVALPAGIDDALPRYVLVNTPSSLEEIRTFIEDIYTNVVFVCLFDLSDEGVESVSIEGRIVGVPGTVTAVIAGAQNATSTELPFVLPLTVYLSQPTLQYRATFTLAGGATRVRPWLDWRLDVRGNVVEMDKKELQEG